MLIYLLKVNFFLLVFTLAYWLLLRKGELLQLNRLILAFGILLAFLLPALPTLTSFTASMPAPLQELSGRAAAALPVLEEEIPVAVPETDVEQSAPPVVQPSQRQEIFPRYLFWGILVVSVGLLLLVVRQFLRIFKLIIYSSNERREGLTLVHTDEDVPPFAFFRYLVINPENYRGEALHQIIVHEKVHIRQHHYLDILLAEFLRIVCWYNPAVWLLNSLLKMNLEYIADREVLSAGINRKSYQYQLLDMSVRGQSLRLTTPMNYSPIKMRITMMNTKKSSFLTQLKYVLLLPICGFALMVISPAQAQAIEVNPAPSSETTAITGTVATAESSATTATALAGRTGTTTIITGTEKNVQGAVTVAPIAAEDIFFVIRPSTERDVLRKAQEELAKRGITVKYHNLNYNDDRLTSISVSVMSDHFSGNLSHNPLEKPLVFYQVKIDGQRKVGFETGMPRSFSNRQHEIAEEVSGLLIMKGGNAFVIRGRAVID